MNKRITKVTGLALGDKEYIATVEVYERPEESGPEADEPIGRSMITIPVSTSDEDAVKDIRQAAALIIERAEQSARKREQLNKLLEVEAVK